MLRTQVQDILANMKTLGQTDVKVDGKGRMLPVDLDLEPEFATDKEQVKLVPCRDCARPMVVTTFFTPEKAQCRVCLGDTGTAVASVASAVPGETDPAKAMNLARVLLNPQFAEAVCPVCIEPMELKMVNHNDHYGPGHWVQTSKGPVWEQIAKGETVMHQCNTCLIVISISNTARHQFTRINEVRPGKNANALRLVLGVRDDKESAA